MPRIPIFDQNVPSITVDSEKPVGLPGILAKELDTVASLLIYEAGAMTLAGEMRQQFFFNKVAEYLQKLFKYDKEKEDYDFEDDTDREQFMALQGLMLKKGISILMASVNPLTVDQVIKWSFADRKFFNACYDAAVRQNKELDPRHFANLPEPQNPVSETNQPQNLPGGLGKAQTEVQTRDGYVSVGATPLG